MLISREQIQNTVQGKHKLEKFLDAVVPEQIPYGKDGLITQSKQDFVRDICSGIDAATMSLRVTFVLLTPLNMSNGTNFENRPYILSRINWRNPRNDPIFRQFLPLKSLMLPDHPKLTLDSLHETADSPVKGLVHRYPDKALFLGESCIPTDKNAFNGMRTNHLGTQLQQLRSAQHIASSVLDPTP